MSSGVVTASGGVTGATTYIVSGSHHFSRHKLASATVTIVENGGGQTVIPLMTVFEVNHREAGSSQQHPGPRSRGAAHGLVVGKNHPTGALAFVQAKGHLTVGVAGAALPASRTAALVGRIPQPFSGVRSDPHSTRP
jgi:hypothetical protein